MKHEFRQGNGEVATVERSSAGQYGASCEEVPVSPDFIDWMPEMLRLAEENAALRRAIPAAEALGVLKYADAETVSAAKCVATLEEENAALKARIAELEQKIARLTSDQEHIWYCEQCQRWQDRRVGCEADIRFDERERLKEEVAACDTAVRAHAALEERARRALAWAEAWGKEVPALCPVDLVEPQALVGELAAVARGFQADEEQPRAALRKAGLLEEEKG